MEASENGTDYHYTHDTEGRVLSKRAWGDKHNIERSISMENLLNKIGIFDNASGREYIYTC
mgnify:CR=1 FL=1